MLQSVIAAFSCIQQAHLFVPRDARLPALATHRRVNSIISDCVTVFEQHWYRLLQSDAIFLVIAPESNGLLEQRCEQLQQAGKLSLGCTQTAIRLCSDKLQTAHHLQSSTIVTIPTVSAAHWSADRMLFSMPDGCVVKPRYGAGCLETFKFNTTNELQQHLSNHTEAQLDNLLVQPYIKGIACSMTLLCDQQTVSVISINKQHLCQQNGQLQVESVTLNDTPIAGLSLQQATQLAQRIYVAIEGLWGIIGVDLIVSSSTVTVVEINPRFTAAYCALSASTSVQVATMLINNLSARNS